MRAAYPVFRVLFPNQVIRADDLARAMVHVAISGMGERRSQVLENRGIRAMGDGQTGNSADWLPDQGHYSLISAAARRRIIATQKTRWAEWRTQHKKK
jgi:hypothetical protein